MLVALRIDQLAVGRDRGAEALGLGAGLAHSVYDLGHLTTDISDIFCTNQNYCGAIWKNFLNATAHGFLAVKAEFHSKLNFNIN